MGRAEYLNTKLQDARVLRKKMMKKRKIKRRERRGSWDEKEKGRNDRAAKARGRHLLAATPGPDPPIRKARNCNAASPKAAATATCDSSKQEKGGWGWDWPVAVLLFLLLLRLPLPVEVSWTPV